jgi:hypothetical protein
MRGEQFGQVIFQSGEEKMMDSGRASLAEKTHEGFGDYEL